MCDSDRLFVEFVDGEMGSRLRGVVRCRDDTCEWLTLRSDLDGTDRRDLDLYAVAQRRTDTADGTALHVSETATVLRIPDGRAGAVVVSIDPHTPIEPGLIRGCRAILADEGPQRPERRLEP
jgi:hypothetical protein